MKKSKITGVLLLSLIGLFSAKAKAGPLSRCTEVLKPMINSALDFKVKELPWSSTDDFVANHLADFVDARYAKLGSDIVILDTRSKFYSRDHEFAANVDYAPGDYEPQSLLAQDQRYQPKTFVIDYSPYVLKGHIPWVQSLPFLDSLAGKLGVGGSTLEHLENFGQTRRVRVLMPPWIPVPAGGYPVVLMSHGFRYPFEVFRKRDTPFGGYNEARMIHALLNQGFAVVLLDAEFGLAWESNALLARHVFKLTSDYFYLKQTLKMIKDGKMGPIHPTKKFALGISSGGYNTSRLANTFPKEFLGVGILAAGYMNNLADVPGFNKIGPIHIEHPATLLMHGWDDHRVPMTPSLKYYNVLRKQGIQAQYVLFSGTYGGHEWPLEAPHVFTKYFLNLLSN